MASVTPHRFEIVRRKLGWRQPDLTVLLEGVHKTHNFSAILRSCDAVGVMTAHAIPPLGGLPLANHTSQGAEKWVAIERHADIERAVTTLRQRNFTLLATHVNATAVDFREAVYTQPVCIVLGAEKKGVSEAALHHADGAVHIPMQGMVDSLNVSVAAALVLFEAQRQRLAAGFYDSCRLSPECYRDKLFEWLYPRLARHCRDHRLPYPALDASGTVKGTIKGSAGDPFVKKDRPS